ncbi:MAG: thrombospondin type 3 repeat-containing protein [Verrucomicrobia bacterium]|nr:thrombospondin type 3 repeat-containing protein [Verrucomicrobiota bacterium]
MTTKSKHMKFYPQGFLTFLICLLARFAYGQSYQLNALDQLAQVNQDGHNNLWHYQHGTDPTNPDSDGDGVSNADELRAGTDPNDPASVFKVLGLVMNAGVPEIRWSSVAGKHYRVERSTNLAAGFSPLQTGISATPPQNAYHDVSAIGPGPCFYRVVLE